MQLVAVNFLALKCDVIVEEEEKKMWKLMEKHT